MTKIFLTLYTIKMKNLQGSKFIYEFITSNDRAIWILRKIMMDILFTILMIIGAKEIVLETLPEYFDKQVVLWCLSGTLHLTFASYDFFL